MRKYEETNVVPRVVGPLLPLIYVFGRFKISSRNQATSFVVGKSSSIMNGAKPRFLSKDVFSPIFMGSLISQDTFRAENTNEFIRYCSGSPPKVELRREPNRLNRLGFTDLVEQSKNLLGCDAGFSLLLRAPDLRGRPEANEVTGRAQWLPNSAQGQGRRALQDHLHVVRVDLVPAGGPVPVIPGAVVGSAWSHPKITKALKPNWAFA